MTNYRYVVYVLIMRRHYEHTAQISVDITLEIKGVGVRYSAKAGPVTINTELNRVHHCHNAHGAQARV